jgi:uncharacterized membrane protein YidH (DUF202 family)
MMHHAHAVQALVRTRVEPKTFFANERTFLQWCGSACCWVVHPLLLNMHTGSHVWINYR